MRVHILAMFLAAVTMSTTAHTQVANKKTLTLDGAKRAAAGVEATSNVAWGGDGSDLFITTRQSVYRFRLATRGAR